MVNQNFKLQLHEHIMSLVNDQVLDITKAINQQNEGAQGNSSAGDKHNTEGAMQHLELEKKHVQLAMVLQNQQTLQKINFKKGVNSVNTGALIKMNKGLFYFSVAMGKIDFLKQEVMVISIASPIGQILKGLKKGESLTFNEQIWEISEIF
ncbi:MAG: transcription elongation GreA/GreB family factor [Saprospiraceae bacterium]|jgi:transcription elongation GreA/GreB family factor